MSFAQRYEYIYDFVRAQDGAINIWALGKTAADGLSSVKTIESARDGAVTVLAMYGKINEGMIRKHLLAPPVIK